MSEWHESRKLFFANEFPYPAFHKLIVISVFDVRESGAPSVVYLRDWVLFWYFPDLHFQNVHSFPSHCSPILSIIALTGLFSFLSDPIHSKLNLVVDLCFLISYCPSPFIVHIVNMIFFGLCSLVCSHFSINHHG